MEKIHVDFSVLEEALLKINETLRAIEEELEAIKDKMN